MANDLFSVSSVFRPFMPGKLSQVPPVEVLVMGCDRRPELPVMVKL